MTSDEREEALAAILSTRLTERRHEAELTIRGIDYATSEYHRNKRQMAKWDADADRPVDEDLLHERAHILAGLSHYDRPVQVGAGAR